MRVLSTLALFTVLRALDVPAETMPTALLLPRLRAGEPADLALLTEDGAAALSAEGILEAPVALARSFVGIAVRRGAAHPAIDTPAALRAALVAAPSIGLSRAGASGAFFAGLLGRMGLSEIVAAKAVVIESGFTAELASSGRVALAVQQVSELLAVDGVEVVGRLPTECGGESLFSGAVTRNATEPEAARALLRRIAGAGSILRGAGLAPA